MTWTRRERGPATSIGGQARRRGAARRERRAERGAMLKHKGMPGRFPGTDHQFTLRRAAKTVTPLIARERYADRKKADLEVDAFFLASLVDLYGEAPFERGNLDAGRLSWLFEREIVAAETPFDPESYEALLRIDMARAARSFPEAL